jgi:hypothetical protein
MPGWTKRLRLCPEVPPCKMCADRAAGCHAVCERYAEYKRFCEERRQARRWDSDVTAAEIDAAARMKKARR